jgi:hypothetical protein
VSTLRARRRNGLTGILKQLLAAGAEHMAMTSEGHTPLALARDGDQKAAVAILEAFAATGSTWPPIDPDLDGVSEEDAALMAELDALEVKPKPISSGPLIKNKKMVADKSEDNADGFGKVYVGKAPPPQMMKHMTGGKKMSFDPSAAPAPVSKAAALPHAAEAAAPAHSSPATTAPKTTPAPKTEDDPDPPLPTETVVYSSGHHKGARDTVEADAVYSVVSKKFEGKPHVPRAGTKSLRIGVDDDVAGNSGGGGNSGGSGSGGPVWLDNLGSAVSASQTKPRAKPPTISDGDDLDDYDTSDVATDHVVEDYGYAVPDEGDGVYATVNDILPGPPPVPTSARPTESAGGAASNIASPVSADASLAEFFKSLSLPDSCLELCEDAGIDTKEDFAMFSEQELVSNHGFKGAREFAGVPP